MNEIGHDFNLVRGQNALTTYQQKEEFGVLVIHQVVVFALAYIRFRLLPPGLADRLSCSDW